jgi:DNA topoisomerase VI subunit A
VSISKKEISSNDCKHKFTQVQEWEPFRKFNSQYISYRIRWNVCINCNKKNKLKSNERELYGDRRLKGNISDVINISSQELAKLILRNLYKNNNNKRWSNWRTNLLKFNDFQSIIDTITLLNEYGILIKREARDKNRQSERWKTTKIYYNDDFLEDIKTFIGIQDTDNSDWMNRPFASFLKEPKMKKSKEIKIILQQQKKQYESEGKAAILGLHGVEVISSTKSRRGYMKLIRILYGLFEIIENKNEMHWKTFSQYIFKDTKEISSSDKKRVKLLFGEDLSEYGIIPKRDEIIVRGDFDWIYNECQGKSRAFKDYLPLPRDMISNMKITSWKNTFLLIIENHDLYFSVLKRKDLNYSQWAVLYGGGYISSEKVKFIRKACKYNLKKIYIWPDLDPYGYLIALDIAKKVKSYDIDVYLFGFNKHWFEKSDVYKSLELIDLKVIDNLLNTNKLSKDVREVLLEMKKRNKKSEQEILIERLENKMLSDYIKNESVSLLL